MVLEVLLVGVGSHDAAQEGPYGGKGLAYGHEGPDAHGWCPAGTVLMPAAFHSSRTAFSAGVGTGPEGA